MLAYTSQLPPQKGPSKLQRLLQPLLALNSSSGSTPAAAAADSQVLADLLMAAFDTPHGSSGDAAAAEELLLGVVPEDSDNNSSTPTAAAAGGGLGGGDGSGAGKRGVLDAGVLQLLRQRAAAAALQLREDIRGASVVTLAPGEPRQLYPS